MGKQAMKSSSAQLLVLAAAFVVQVARGFTNTNEELPECRDGDKDCYVTAGHRLFTEGQHAEGVSWFEKAGEALPAAADGLGFAYETGQGKAQNPARAFELYHKAANGGSANGAFHLGNCYGNGVGVAADQAAALKWFRVAAQQGHAS